MKTLILVMTFTLFPGLVGASPLTEKILRAVALSPGYLEIQSKIAEVGAELDCSSPRGTVKSAARVDDIIAAILDCYYIEFADHPRRLFAYVLLDKDANRVSEFSLGHFLSGKTRARLE